MELKDDLGWGQKFYTPSTSDLDPSFIHSCWGSLVLRTTQGSQGLQRWTLSKSIEGASYSYSFSWTVGSAAAHTMPGLLGGVSYSRFCCWEHLIVAEALGGLLVALRGILVASCLQLFLFISTQKISLDANLIMLLPIKIVYWGLRRVFMTDPHRPPSQLWPACFSFGAPRTNCSRSPLSSAGRTSVPLLMPFPLFGMRFLLAFLAVLFSRKFSSACTPYAHVPPLQSLLCLL